MIGIFLAIFVVFIFWASGSAISYMCNLTLNNTFINIGIGFFAYFAIISLCIFPLQVISIIPFVYFLYILLIITCAYVIVTLALIRFWLTMKIFSFDSIVFMILFVSFYFLDLWLNNMESSKGQFNFYKNSLSVLYWIKDLQVSLFGDILTGDLKFKNIQSWYTFQLTLLLVSGQLNLFDQNKIAIFANLYTNFNLIIDVCLSASLVLCATWAMGRKTNKIQLVIFTAINALCLCCLKYVLVRDNFTIWNEESYFVYLVAFIIFILYDYVVTVERAKNQPLLIGLILSSYIAFSWVLSYQILFLIYSILFILQIWLRNIFVKELYKISLLFGVDFIFFNIIEKLYLLSLIYAGVILLFSLILYLMNKNYNIVINFETALNNRREFSILAIPIIIIVASLFIGLMQKSNDLFLLSSQGVFLLYPLFELLFNTNKLLYTVVFSYVLLIASVIWIFYRHNKVFGRVKMPIDILAINFLTFYNPYAVRTLKTLVYINLEMSNVAILIISLYVIILWVLNKIHNQFFSFIKIKSIRKKQIIYNIEVRKY